MIQVSKIQTQKMREREVQVHKDIYNHVPVQSINMTTGKYPMQVKITLKYC